MWVVSHNFPLNFSLEISAVVLISSLVASHLVKKQMVDSSIRTQNKIIYADVVSVGAGLLILIAILIVPVIKSKRSQGHIYLGSTVENYINTSLDDSSQLSRVNDRLQLNRGVLYASNVTPYVVLRDTISSYPSSWHSANAVLIKSLHPNIKVGGQSLIAYVATKILWLFILVYCFSRVTFTVFSVFMNRQRRNALLSDNIWLVGAICFFSYYTLLEQFKEGFYVFIPLLIYNLLCLVLLVQLGADKSEKKPTRRYRALLPLTLMMTSATLSWFLVLPAVLVALLLAVFDPIHLSGANLRTILSQLWLRQRAHGHLFLLCAVSILVQALVITAGSSRSFSEGINDPGAITMHSPQYFAFIGIGTLLFYGLFSRKFKIIREISPFLVSLLGMALIIYIFQILTIGKPEYYYFKTLNTVIIVVLPLAIIGWLMLIRIMAIEYGRLTTLIASASLLICLPLVIGIQPLNTSNLGYIKGKREFSTTENSLIYNSLSTRAKVPITERTEDVIFFTPNQVGHNIVGTNILRTIQPVDNCDAIIFTTLLTNDQSALFKVLSSCSSAQLTIVTRPDTYQILMNDVTSNRLGHRVKILVVQ